MKLTKCSNGLLMVRHSDINVVRQTLRSLGYEDCGRGWINSQGHPAAIVNDGQWYAMVQDYSNN